MSHYSAIGDTISCDAPYSAIGFRGKPFMRYPLVRPGLWIAIGHLYRKTWGCSSDSLRYHRKHSATGVLLHQSRDRGGYFGRVTKLRGPYSPKRGSRHLLETPFSEPFCTVKSIAGPPFSEPFPRTLPQNPSQNPS